MSASDTSPPGDAPRTVDRAGIGAQFREDAPGSRARSDHVVIVPVDPACHDVRETVR